jgi:hypothetical protein
VSPLLRAVIWVVVGLAALFCLSLILGVAGVGI